MYLYPLVYFISGPISSAMSTVIESKPTHLLCFLDEKQPNQHLNGIVPGSKALSSGVTQLFFAVCSQLHISNILNIDLTYCACRNHSHRHCFTSKKLNYYSISCLCEMFQLSHVVHFKKIVFCVIRKVQSENTPKAAFSVKHVYIYTPTHAARQPRPYTRVQYCVRQLFS